MSTLRSDDLLSSSQTINVKQILALRSDLTLVDASTGIDQTSFNVVLNQSLYNSRIAIFAMCKTLFVCLVLLVLMQMFNKDIDTLLIEPIENMMDKLMLMAKDP